MCPTTAERTLLTGHNPGLEDLIDYLDHERTPETATDRHADTVDPAGRLEFAGPRMRHRRAGGAFEDIADGFPFPGPDGTERRPRPSYYYTQSAVIPYRFEGAQLQVLVVASSKQRHLVVPKGIQTPGMTAQTSAAKEALEEAGVLGDVGDESLGSYQYTKWGATVTCVVYPMHVTEVIPEADWEERHRGREWLSAADAAERLKQPELRPMVFALAERLAG